jgi:integrase/recombinase XerC
MARDLFKVIVTHYYLPDGQRCRKGTPGAIAKRVNSKKWYGRIPGTRNPVPLSANKEAARIMLGEKTKRAALRDAGATDPFESHRKRPLSDHVADFRRELEGRGNSDRYPEETIRRLQRLIGGCRFKLIADISPSRVVDWLADLRQKVHPRAILPDAVESFTLNEAASLLGRKPVSVRAAVYRHRLPAKGNARRLPRATVVALQDLAAKGASARTSNKHLADLKAFCRWLVKDRRTADNPVLHLEPVNEDVDRRHDRRELDTSELRRLLGAARNSERVFRGLDGWDRFHLYATACGTGFRAAALASLTPESFDLDSNSPTVTLAARFAKNRKTKVQPLPADVAELLRAYLQDKPANGPVWSGTWASDRRGAQMLRLDLDAAAIPYVIEGTDGPLFADFHSLRHSYITLAGRAGIDLRTLQELAGHSTPVLTARYSHRKLYDLAGAVEKLPSILPTTLAQVETLSATGTEGAICLRTVCANNDTSGDSPGLAGNLASARPNNDTGRNPLQRQQVAAGSDSSSPAETSILGGIRTRDLRLERPAATPQAPRGHRSVLPTTDRCAGRQQGSRQRHRAAPVGEPDHFTAL